MNNLVGKIVIQWKINLQEIRKIFFSSELKFVLKILNISASSGEMIRISEIVLVYNLVM